MPEGHSTMVACMHGSADGALTAQAKPAAEKARRVQGQPTCLMRRGVMHRATMLPTL